jgi:hypothetical protein
VHLKKENTMKTAYKIICTLAAGAALSAAAPAFADSWHGHGYGYGHRDYGRHEFREHERFVSRYYYAPRRVVVVERPVIVQRSYIAPAPILYSAPMPAYGPAQMLGSAIGSYIDNQNY